MNPNITSRAQLLRTAIIVVLSAVTLAPSVASAANKYWIGGSDWWDVGTNWNSAGQPQNGDYVYLTQSDSTNRTISYANTLYPSAVLTQLIIDATGAGNITLSQSKDPLKSISEYVGYSGTGTITQIGGTNTIDPSVGSLILGAMSSGRGVYNLSGTGSLTASSEYIGSNGTGTFNQDGGTNTVSSQLFLGQGTGGSGSYNLSSGNLTVQNNGEYIGNLGTGVFIQSGGTHIVGTQLYLGYSSGSHGTYNLSGTGSLNAYAEFIGFNGTGSFTQRGGVNIVQGQLNVSDIGGGGYNLIDGSLIVAYESIFGPGTSAAFVQSGGTHTISQMFTISGGGTYNLDGGSLSTNNTEYVGFSGVGTFNQIITARIISANNSSWRMPMAVAHII